MGLFATGYHALLSNLLKKPTLIFFKQLTVTRGKGLQITQNQANHREVTRMVTRVATRVVMHSSCGNTLHYG